MSTRTKQPQQQLCALTIGYSTYLLPPEDGMKVMQLMQKAVECERDLARSSADWLYLVRDRPKLELTIVNANQVRQRQGDEVPPGGTLLLGGPAR